MTLRFSPSRGAGSLVLNALVRGPTGAAATISAGTTTTLAEGASATAANSGTTSAAVFDFGIPRGAIPAIGFNFDTSTTDADPGAGDVRFNNATPASVTAIYFDNVDRDGNTVTTWLDSFDDSTTTTKGTLIFTPAAGPKAKLIYTVTGSIVDGTGYRKVTVSHVAGTTLPSSAAHLAVSFDRVGDKGADGSGTFPGASTDNAIVRFDGTAGTTVQNSAVLIDDTTGTTYPAVSDSGALGSSTKMWGDLFLASGGVVNFNNGNVTITHSAGVLASNSVMVALNHADGYTTTATAAGTTTLTLASTALQYFTGSTTQTVVLPVTSTLTTGHKFRVVNNSTGNVTAQSSGANNVLVMGPGSDAEFVCILTSGTTAASWYVKARYANVPQNSQSAAYTTVISDAGKHILHPAADNNPRTFTIDSNANVPYPIGTTITFINQINTVTIAITTDTLTLSSAGTTGSRTLAVNGMATAIKVTSTLWFISGTGLT